MGLLDALGGGARPSIHVSPIMLGLAGLLAYRTLKGKGRLADLLGTGTGAPSPAATGPGDSPTSAPTGPGAGAGWGALGNLFAGGGLSAGIKDLLDRFHQAGHEQTAQSWVSSGANQPITPQALEQALGDERLHWLVEQTGLPKDQLLAGLSGELPETINKLTPNGYVPSDEELALQRSRQG